MLQMDNALHAQIIVQLVQMDQYVLHVLHVYLF